MSPTMSEPEDVLIHFTTPGGTSPLTWGQRWFWSVLTRPGEESSFNICRILAVPPGRSVHDVADAIRTLVQRHHGLVTRFPRYPTDPYQEVAERGTIRLTVHAATADEAALVAEKVRAETDRHFRHEDEWPVRFALVLADGAPRQLVMVFSHLAVDGEGVWIVSDELGQLLGGRALPPAEGTWSPLALAGYERSVEGRARSASAMRYQRGEMLEYPSTIFDFAMVDPEPSRFWRFRTAMPAVAVAAGRIARLHRCSAPAVFLAAVAAVLGHYTGHSRIPLQLVSSNRWRPQVSRAVSQLTQLGMFSVGLGDMSFGDLARVTWRRALMCYQNAACDPLDQEREAKVVRRLTGAATDKRTQFNVLRTDDRPPASTGMELADQWNGFGETLSFTVFDPEEHAVVDLGFDTAFIPERVARQMLTGMESLLVQAAARAVRLDEVGAITGIGPVVRGQGWVRVDGAGWVAPAEVANVVAEAPDVVRCAVFVEPVGARSGTGRLVAYVVASRSDVTPELVHDQVCARLDGFTGVKAPQHYVLCAGSPTHDSHTAWRSRPVLVSGSGRC
jgi:hypothetical protein